MCGQVLELFSGQFYFQALGAGTGSGDFENQLIEAPEEEEEFDVLNDETFGHCEDGGDFDWEEEHERLAEELEGESFFDLHTRDFTKDSGYGNAERSYRSQEEYLEQSISRLVVEDEEEEERLEREKFFGKGQPIPVAKIAPHLDELFGPASPPALLDAEHLASPSTKNIWGSPAENVFQKPATALRKLFESARGGYPPGMESPVPGVLQPLAPQSPATLPQAHTLEEIERQMLSRGKKPQVLTAEELERQMRGESAPAHPPSAPQMVSQPPPRQPLHQGTGPLPPGLLPASALAGDHRSPYPMSMPPIGHPLPGTPPHRVIPGMSPVSQQSMANGRTSPILIMPSGKVLPQRMMPSGSPQLTQGRTESPVGQSASTPTPPLPPGVTSLLRSPHPIRLMSPYNVTAINGPSSISLGNRMMGPPPGMPCPIPRGPMPPSPMGTPPGARMPIHPGVQDMSPHSHPHPPPHHHLRNNPPPTATPDRRQEGIVQHGSYTSQSHNDKNRAYRTNYQRPPPWQQHHHHHQQDAAEDEYAGLMTKREKDWIIKIQLLQLNTDNPYLDDYYYTYYTLRKKQRESGGGDADNLSLKLLIPNIAKIETKAYTPAQFEGSLGRLTTASVHNPRHIIDVTRGASPTEESTKKNVSKELRRFRQLLMDIEKGYVLLLDVDDIEKKVFALPEDNRLPLFIERHEKIGQLYQYFTCDESIEQYTQILGVRKGRKLLARVLPLLSKNQAHVALCILFHHMHHLVRKDAAEEGLCVLTRSVCAAMEGSDLESLVRLVDVLRGEKPLQAGAFLLPLFRNQFSATVLCCLLQQAEAVYKDTSPVDMDNQLQTEWNKFIEEFAEALESVPLKDLPSPPVRLPLVEPHFSRLLNAQLMGRLEDKVQRLTTPAESSTTTTTNTATASSTGS
nr:hypothetical protein BaRGS_033701 [Batillaria attramentaria]